MAPPSPNSNPNYSEEEPIANALLRAIDLAINDVIDDPGREPTRLEQEKLCYFAIEEFDLPVTYSWYLAGACTKVTGDPENAPGRQSLRTPTHPSDCGEDDEVQKYREYFTSETFFDDYNLKKVWYTNKFDFLRDFYSEFAGEYTDLYLASTNIRECLEDLDEIAENDTTNRSLTDFGVDTETKLVTQEDEEKLRLYVSDLHLELAQLEELSETRELVTKGTDLIEQVFAQLTTVESMSKSQEKAIEEIGEFFYYGVWRYPALYISTRTANGPNEDQLVAEHANRFLGFHKELLGRQTQLQERCNHLGLYPDAGHHSRRVNEEQVAHLQEMAKEVIEGAE